MNQTTCGPGMDMAFGLNYSLNHEIHERIPVAWNMCLPCEVFVSFVYFVVNNPV